MKSLINCILTITGLLLVLSSCGKKETGKKATNNISDHQETSLIMTFDDTTIVKSGDIGVFKNGYFYISGLAPDGSIFIMETGEIMIGETRSFCNDKEDTEARINCIANKGFEMIRITAFNNRYDAVSGTAKRNSDREIEISGIIKNAGISQEHSINIKVKAGIYVPADFENK